MLRKEKYKHWMQVERNRDERFNLNVIAYETNFNLLEYFTRDADFFLRDQIHSGSLYYIFHWAVQAQEAGLSQLMSFFGDLVQLLKRESYEMRLKPQEI